MNGNGLMPLADAVPMHSDSMFQQVLKCTCYLEDIGMYSDFNDVYLEYFGDAATRPARVCFAGAKRRQPSVSFRTFWLSHY